MYELRDLDLPGKRTGGNPLAACDRYKRPHSDGSACGCNEIVEMLVIEEVKLQNAVSRQTRWIELHQAEVDAVQRTQRARTRGQSIRVVQNRAHNALL